MGGEEFTAVLTGADETVVSFGADVAPGSAMSSPPEHAAAATSSTREDPTSVRFTCGTLGSELPLQRSGGRVTVRRMGNERTFRVTVRGRFHELSERSRAYLQSARAEHDIFVSAYTPDGSLTYDDRLDFFNLRYEWRADDAETAGVECLEQSELFFGTLKFGFRDLRVNVVDLSAMWDDAARRTAR